MEQTVEPQMKFCKWCGHKIPREAVICTACGCQVEELKSSAPTVAPSIVVQNTNTSQSTSSGVGGGGVAAPRIRNKWVALVLCCLFGWFGAHKFYEGKVGRGLAYLFTFMVGLSCTDVESEEMDFGALLLFVLSLLMICDILVLCFKPTSYTVER